MSQGAAKLEGVPRLIAFRLGPLWVAASINDFGEVVESRLGFTRAHARFRVVRHS